MLPRLEGLSYRERLCKLRCYSLEHRRMTGDIIEVYKIMRGIDRVDAQCVLPRVGESRAREHMFKVRERSN